MPEKKTEEQEIIDKFTDNNNNPDDFNFKKLGELPEKIVLSLFNIRIPCVGAEMTSEKREKILNTIQPGDIFLETCNAYPGWQVAESVVIGSNKYTHVAIYEGNGKIIEATTDKRSSGNVMRSDIDSYLHGPELIEIIRPSYKTPEDKEAALDYCRSQIGKPYDGKFDLKDNEEHYCAELIYKGLQAMPNKIDVPGTTLLAQNAVSPDNFQNIEGTVVYSDKSNLWKNIASHYPVAIGTGLSAMAGGAVLGPAGAVSGFIGGFLLSVATGNKLQTDHFGLYDF